MILSAKNKKRWYHMNEYGSSQTIRANNPRSNLTNLRCQMKSVCEVRHRRKVRLTHAAAVIREHTFERIKDLKSAKRKLAEQYSFDGGTYIV